LRTYATLTEDKTLLTNLNLGDKNENENALIPLIYQGKDEEVDRLIDALQRNYVKRNMGIANLGGADG
jgi:hypothetical protein